MLKKIGRRTFLRKYPNFPVSDYYHDKHRFPEAYNRYVLYVNSGSTAGLCHKIAVQTTLLFKLMGSDSLLCQGDSTTPWLYRKHAYPPVAKALQYLHEQNIGMDFNGAIVAGADDIVPFLKNLFWLVRGNGVIFYPYFCNPEFTFIVYLSQYGSLHFYTLSSEADEMLNAVIGKTQLQVDLDNSYGGWSIPGRKSTFTA